MALVGDLAITVSSRAPVGHCTVHSPSSFFIFFAASVNMLLAGFNLAQNRTSSIGGSYMSLVLTGGSLRLRLFLLLVMILFLSRVIHCTVINDALMSFFGYFLSSLFIDGPVGAIFV